MKYVKLKISHQGKITEDWHLIIDNAEDLFKYCRIDSELYAQAFVALDRNDNEEYPYDAAHQGDIRKGVMATMLNLKTKCLKEGDKMYPIIEVAQFCDKKGQDMLDYIQRMGAIQVNQSGGYCGYDSYVNTWKAEVLQTIEKDDVGFPIDEDILKCDTLILENQDKVYSKFRDIVKEMTNTVPAVITMLKERDLSWVVRSIKSATTIAFNSQLQDTEQIDKFMALFASLPKKNLIISCYEHDKSKLTKHPLFEKNKNLHNIQFIHN